ncbi:MerR family transcriptional regulator [Erysipelothrix sp. HDW6C]|uniref:MerR family transcriptional regulator n=1 Tax=Erysipelothrix sp. HDW6C TaxID=2714930 RepID=UPI00140DEE77|nr:MerR family transcriptional regulator [Erysipelothrix sp. HDW6C]QIK69016.1 MerR family transcriptional regulator [Erysipelothrix sp. HDW6C]
MIKIGDFSKLSRLSIRVLRHYDDIDLLKPVFIDPDSSYRFYDASQLKTSHQIQALKDLGLSLSAIREILNSDDTGNTLHMYLRVQRQILADDQTIINQRIAHLDSMVQQLKGDANSMKYTVNTKEIPARSVMSLRQILPNFQSEGESWGMMAQEIGSQSIKYANPSYALAKFHDKEYKETMVDVEIQIAVLQKGEDTKHVKFFDAPAEFVASVLMEGSYENMAAVTESIATWISESNYDFSGPMFNIYLVGPSDDPNPENWITEVCFPIALN